MSAAWKHCPVEPWLYFKMGKQKARYPKEIKPATEIFPWLEWFQERCHYQGEGAKGRNFSIGAAAAVIAIEKGFKKILMAGCDTLINPDMEYVSVYNPHTEAKHSHIWPAENDLIFTCAKQRGATIYEFSKNGITPAVKYQGEGFLLHGLNP